MLLHYTNSTLALTLHCDCRYSFQRKKKAELKKKGGLVEDLQEVVKGNVVDEGVSQ